eukprot:scaffold14203_cov170-Amphora_coffeaeformis.AAC.8
MRRGKRDVIRGGACSQSCFLLRGKFFVAAKVARGPFLWMPSSIIKKGNELPDDNFTVTDCHNELHLMSQTDKDWMIRKAEKLDRRPTHCKYRRQ